MERVQERPTWRVGDVLKARHFPHAPLYRLIKVWQRRGKWQGRIEPLEYPPLLRRIDEEMRRWEKQGIGKLYGAPPWTVGNLDRDYLQLVQTKEQEDSDD